MNPKKILIPVIILVLGITGIYAGLCKGDNGYYQECNTQNNQINKINIHITQNNYFYITIKDYYTKCVFFIKRLFIFSNKNPVTPHSTLNNIYEQKDYWKEYNSNP